MRHLKQGRKLNRTSAHRTAMLRNMAISLIEHERIKTTLPKAKELRRFVEPLITRAKTDSVARRRLIHARLNNKIILGKLFDKVAVSAKNRQGGYTRIIKIGRRAGDNAPIAYIELVDKSSAIEQGTPQKLDSSPKNEQDKNLPASKADANDKKASEEGSPKNA